MKIYELLDMDLLAVMKAQGYVRAQRHPVFPWLEILNYTDPCTFAREWNPVTTQCRGLIWNVDTREVLARPFPKFFNWSEQDCPEIPLHAPVEVTDKMDGSLGILYPIGDDYAIATRGSFTSEQAFHATRVWQERYKHRFTTYPWATMLFEIIYPGNRIVCDYQDQDDLVLLGAVDIDSGCSLGPYEDEGYGNWPGPRAEMFRCHTLADALALAPRPGAEGIVVRWRSTEVRVKIKQADYVQLHRIITNCTARRLWEHLAVHACKHVIDPGFMVKRLFLAPEKIQGILDVGDNWMDAYLLHTPEEFQSWVEARAAEMHDAVARAKMLHRAQLLVLCAYLGVEPPTGVPDRALSKRFAALALEKCPEDFHMVTALWRNQEIESELWRQVRPDHELPYRAVDEAVA